MRPVATAAAAHKIDGAPGDASRDSWRRGRMMMMMVALVKTLQG